MLLEIIEVDDYRARIQVDLQKLDLFITLKLIFHENRKNNGC